MLAEKEKAKLEGHLKTAAVLGMVGFILAIIAQLEIAVTSMIGVAPALPATLIGLPVGWEMFYSLAVFISVLAVYSIAVLVAKLVFVVESAFR